ncbi:MAG: hypothetical protein C4518_17390 [Desulfobacteraceae bacterium]|nr:MAG: hypothetical protein C4518_17390 [Desulfobacteraceae bacterium]
MTVWFSCVLISGIFLFSCSKEPVKADPKSLVISDIEYSIRQTHENSYVLDAKGKIKNTGKLDVKSLVVTGYCKSCVLEFTSHKWFTSDCEKTENQKKIISYLSAGAESEFSFEEVAFYFTSEKVPPEKIPEKIEIQAVSFDTVQSP